MLDSEQTPAPVAESDSPVAALWRRRLDMEREREEMARALGLDETLRLGPRYPEYWLDVLLRLTRLRARGERNARKFVRRDVTLTYGNLPPAFDGFRILHLADLHFMKRDPAFGAAIAEHVRGIEADLCVMTGDYRYEHFGNYDHVFRDLRGLLAAIRARHGVLAVLGNHDLSAFVEPFRAMGVDVLINESRELRLRGDRILFAGVDDPHRFQCDDIHAAMAEVPPEEFTVLLAHSPELGPVAPGHGVDLYLCGHTHCGQVCLPGVGALFWNARVPRKYAQRLWRNGRTWGYTSPGLGTTDLPVRFACPGGAVVFELRRGTLA